MKRTTPPPPKEPATLMAGKPRTVLALYRMVTGLVQGKRRTSFDFQFTIGGEDRNKKLQNV